MNKIPLESTIAGGYRFFFKRIVSVIGTLWFPYLLLAALGGVCAYLTLPHEILRGDFSNFHPAVLRSPPMLAARLVLFVAGVIAGAMVAVNLMRHSLGLKQNTTYFFFSLGAPVWRMAAAVVLGMLLIVVLAVVVTIAGVLGGIAAYHHLETHMPAAIASCFAIGILGLYIVLYCFARLFFFLPAVVVAEEKIGLGRSWSLGGGNFWRIFLVCLLIILPVWFVMGVILQLSVLPMIVPQAMALPPHPDWEGLKPFLRACLHALPVVFTVAIIAGIAVRAMMAGAIGTAYNAVTAPKEEKTSA